jgi:multidrug efflux system outer membrane protein
VLAAFVSACAVGPKFEKPEVAAPAEYRGAAAADAASIADLPWWEVFDDPVLQGLVREAIQANYDLKIAISRVEQARAFLGVSRSPFYPQIGYEGSAGRQRTPEFEQQDHDTFDLFYGAFSLAWEIDLWGRIRRSSEAAREALLASEEFRRGVLLTLVTDVAQAYLSLIELDRELEISRETVVSFAETRDLFRRRFEGGVGNRLQVERAAALLALTEAQIPQLEQAIVAQENALGVLLGRAPGPIPRGRTLMEHSPPPATPPGLPSSLLERRPDILQAQHTIASANAEIGVAVANFFPRVGLTALYGGQSTELQDIVKGSFSLWNVAGNVTGPIFQGFALLERYRGRKAFWEETKAQYESTVITAFAEVADALSDQSKLGTAREAQERAVRSYEESVRLALIRYDSGLAQYFEVLDAQQQLYPAEITLAQIQLRELLTVVTLYRALGGGWQVPWQQWSQQQP